MLESGLLIEDLLQRSKGNEAATNAESSVAESSGWSRKTPEELHALVASSPPRAVTPTVSSDVEGNMIRVIEYAYQS